MKKILEMISVIVVVLCLIGAGVFLTRGSGSESRVAPGGAEVETTTTIIVGGP